MHGYGKIKLSIGAGCQRRSEELSFREGQPLVAVGARDEQLFLLTLITDPGGPGIRNIVEGDGRIVVLPGIAGGEIEGGGYALYFHAAIQEFHRISEVGVRRAKSEIALRGFDANFLGRFHRDE